MYGVDLITPHLHLNIFLEERVGVNNVAREDTIF